MAGDEQATATGQTRPTPLTIEQHLQELDFLAAAFRSEAANLLARLDPSARSQGKAEGLQHAAVEIDRAVATMRRKGWWA